MRLIIKDVKIVHRKVDSAWASEIKLQEKK